MMITKGLMNTAAQILGAIKYSAELTPIISRASICSVTRMVPISEAMFEPTFPASIKEIMVGESSNIIDCRLIRPITYTGMNDESILEAVWIAMTAPMNTESSATIGIEFTPSLSISSMIRRQKIERRSGLENT